MSLPIRRAEGEKYMTIKNNIWAKYPDIVVLHNELKFVGINHKFKVKPLGFQILVEDDEGERNPFILPRRGKYGTRRTGSLGLG